MKVIKYTPVNGEYARSAYLATQGNVKAYGYSFANAIRNLLREISIIKN